MKQKITSIYRLVLLLPLLFLGVAVQAQNAITGTITGAEDGEPLIGVTVLVEGTTTGTVSDLDGNYSIQASATDVLIYSYTGMETQRITVGTQRQIDVALVSSNISLDQVIVTAYGTSKKGAFTGSATQINSEDIQNRGVTNITSALNGAPGIQYSPGSGQPGASSPLRVRGFGSVNASADPLYVVDGIIFSGNLNSLNPNDIESLTVLKDAASTALYGAKAANGVVLITTKSGRTSASGRSTMNVNISQGFSGRALPEYERVGPAEYYELQWEALRNSFLTTANDDLATANQKATDQIFTQLGTNPFNVPNNQIVGTDGRINPNAELLYPDDLDWQEPLTRLGNRTEANVAYQGGTEKTSYYSSLGYIDDQGWILASDFRRVSGRLNVTTSPRKWIRTGFNANVATSTANQAADGGSTSFVNPFFSTRTIAPIYSVFEHDPVTGAFLLDDAGNRIYDLGANRVGNTSGRHVIQETLLNQDIDRNSTIGGRAFVDLTFLPELTLTVNAGYDNRAFNNVGYGNTIVGDAAPNGRAFRTNTVTNSLSFNQLLNYKKDFGIHNLSLLVGHESFEYENNYLYAFRTSQIATGNNELINFATLEDATSNTTRYTTEGYLARAEYDFDGRYFLSASFRADGSSRFAEDVRWGQFYSVGGAWRLDQEAFIDNLPWVDLLKLRASYGEVGNDSNLDFGALSAYASQALFSLGFNNASEPGILVGSLGAPNLEWETNAQTDVALEFSLFNYRLNGTIEYYNRNTDNLIFEVPLPLSTGNDNVLANIGSMFNRGIELNLSGDIIRTPKFTWTLDVNGSTIRNEFTELPQEEIITGTKKLVVGGSIYDYWLRDYYGVDPADGAALYRLNPEVSATDASVRILNGDTLTTNFNNAKFDFVGTAVPDLFGAITNKFQIGNFRFGFLVTYQIGGQTYDTNHANLLSNGNFGSALSVDIRDRWQQPGDVTLVPRLDASQTNNFGAASSRFLVKSDFLAIRQANISYNIPDALMSRLGMSNFTIYANAENLFLDTARKGMDVNQNFNGTTSNRFTPSRVVTFGINTTF
ncbi:SusC/RagA family TonB-linked outer membrane protein [Neolewinella lacunae]|uniref:SusC/RagA family TonB-linked outer membrane protein n=1 Tax=Neolewinella lacunae TaxID=1517758 RepID=A0A923PQK0_9BACT|nr:SusC/RagA family TonB-linked outer membrane protein [Neolewinella lacunae]MBC6996725.1 SusC/RagA family TonB-linked outer membrane protein [Neolewinella lacunae]MDN3633410.1 SusC/RagA family TonB-linked outer membrane protein [Neolewinella lacunae]